MATHRKKKKRGRKRNSQFGPRPPCKECGEYPRAIAYYRKRKTDGKKTRVLKPWCARCNTKKYNTGHRKKWKYKKDMCEKCGFVPVHKIALHVDHIDGNSSNNDPSNFQTLCANCHAHKTYENKEFLPLEDRPKKDQDS